jgi:hypothetical protein
MSKYTRVTCNLKPVNTRHETLEGKDYLVVPCSMLTEGVHAGSDGPLYYPKEQLAKTPAAWNHKPVTLYHPSEGTSACDPEVIERQKMGLTMKSHYDQKLGGEAWLDEGKLRKSTEGAAVLNAINEGKPVEVSTGLWYDPIETPGEWNGEKYNAIVSNIRPDHLAILYGQVGACSIADGAGLLVNKDGELSFEDRKEQIRGLMKAPSSEYSMCSEDGYCYVCDIFSDHAIVEKKNKVYKVAYTVRKGKVALLGEPEEVRKVTSYVAANSLNLNEDSQGPLKFVKPHEGELSEIVRRQQFSSTLQKHYKGITQEGDWGGWTTELFANYAVFKKDGKTWQLPYTYDDDQIKFGADPEDVSEQVKITDYRNKNNSPLGGTTDPPQTFNKDTSMVKRLVIEGVPEAKLQALLQNAIHMGAHGLIHEPETAVTPHKDGTNSDTQTRTFAGGARKKEVDSMISSGAATEGQRTMLESMPDDHFASIKAFATKGAVQPIVPYTYEGIGDRSNAPHGTHNVQTPQDLEAYLKTQPPVIADIVRNHLSQQTALRSKLVGVLTNRAPNLNPEWIKKASNKELQNMVNLLTEQKPTVNYGGQADVPMFLDSPTTQGGNTTTNAQQGLVENMEILSLPNWNADAVAG